MAQPSDNELVELCLEGDNTAFNMLVERHQLTMYRTAFSIVKSTDLAKDVTQNGFIKAWEKLHSFNPKYKFYSWLYRIIVNEALNKVRNTKNFERLSVNKSDEKTPYQQIIKKEENRKLYRAIESLPTEFSTVIYLRHFEELSYEEIAEVLEIDKKKVKSRLYGARMKLRAILFIEQ
ncbi:MAG: sigma-70 family RNA polymerase sigma factor [Balneolaceae bacterium]|nr:sigma-70 family RNA polymerase sigma factor [Balneolaceae bacterium]